MATTIQTMKLEKIHNVEQLHAFCLDIANQDWLVIDTEFIREKTYYPNLCLIQIASDERAACIDTLAIDNLSTLQKLIYSNKVTKVFHAASQDLEIFFNLYGKIPKPVFDTQIAASALGYGEQVSYASLVNKVCGITIDKSLSRTAWDKRPLSEKELQYALDDVKYLAAIYLKLRSELKTKNRMHWIDDEFERMSDINKYKINASEAWMSVKGVGKLQSSQLIVLKYLAEWRDNQARQENKPLRWILRDKILRALSIEQPITISKLSEIEGLPLQQITKYADPILSCIKKALNTPEQEWPKSNQVTPLSRPQRKLMKHALQLIRDRAEEINTAPSLLATRSAVEKLIRGHRELYILQGWRQEIIGNDLVELLESSNVS